MAKDICRFALPPSITAALARGAVRADADHREIYAVARARVREIVDAVRRGDAIPSIQQRGADLAERVPATRIWVPLGDGEIEALGGDCGAARARLRELIAEALGVEWPSVGRPRVYPDLPAGLTLAQERRLVRLLMAGTPRDEAIALAREYSPRTYRRRKR